MSEARSNNFLRCDGRLAKDEAKRFAMHEHYRIRFYRKIITCDTTFGMKTPY